MKVFFRVEPYSISVKMSIAEERIERLFRMAEDKASEGRQDFADRYVELARKISMKAEQPISSQWKRRYCNECGAFLTPGKNCRIRINSKRKQKIYRCERCENIERYGLEKEG